MTSLADRIASDEHDYLRLCRHYKEPVQMQSGRPDVYGIHAQQLLQREFNEQQKRTRS